MLPSYCHRYSYPYTNNTIVFLSSFVLSYLSWHLCLSLLSFYLLSVVFILILMKLSCHFILTVVFILIPSLFIPLPYSYPSSLSTSSILSSWFLRYLPQHFCLSVNLAAALSVVFTLGPIDVSVFLSSLLLAPWTLLSFCHLYFWPPWTSPSFCRLYPCCLPALVYGLWKYSMGFSTSVRQLGVSA